MGETSSRKSTISSLDNSNKKELPVLIPVIKKSDPKTKNISIAMISTHTYCAVCYLKKVKVFVILMRDI